MSDIAARQWFGHPRGLSTLFFTEMWERFSYYGMRALLFLFMVAPLAAGGLGIRRRRRPRSMALHDGGLRVVDPRRLDRRPLPRPLPLRSSSGGMPIIARPFHHGHPEAPDLLPRTGLIVSARAC